MDYGSSSGFGDHRSQQFLSCTPLATRNETFTRANHRDGTLNIKSFRRVVIRSSKRQPLTPSFEGTEHLGAHSGFAPRGRGAICDPTDFTGLVEVPSGVLGLVAGSITVDLVEPGKATTWIPCSQVVMRKVFRETVPWLVVTIRRSRETILP